MKHIKLFESFEDETTYGKFLHVDISDVQEITFIWSNHPFFGDYKENGFFGSPEKRHELTKIVNKILVEKNISKKRFQQLLIDNGFYVIKETNNNYKVKLRDNDIVTFFHLVETL